MEEKLKRFSEMYRGFFRRIHYHGHEGEEKGIAGKLREFPLTENPIVMNPVEAIGLTKDFASLMDEASSMNVDGMLEQYRRFYDSSFLTKALFFYTLAKYLGEQKSIDEIAEEAERDFQVYGQYSIGKLHKPKEKEHITIFLDWHGTMRVEGGLKFNLSEFLDYCRRDRQRNYSLIITSATFDLMSELGDFSRVLDEIDAAYEVPVILPEVSGEDLTVRLHKAGKIYTDICKKLEVRSDSAVIITDMPADRSVEESYPIPTLVTPKDLGADVWISLLKYFEGQRGNITETANAIRTSPVYIHGNGVSEYGVNGITLYGHEILHNCFFIGEFPEQMMGRAGIGLLDKRD